MTIAKLPKKDPQEVLDYSIDWTARLDGDTITAFTPTLVNAAGVTIDFHTNTTVTSTVWLSGGTLGETVSIRYHVTTAGGRQMERTLSVRIESK